MTMMPKAGQIETHLREHYGDGAVYETRRVIPEMATHFQLTREELAETDGSHLRFEHKVHSALARHRTLKLLERPERGSFKYLPEKLASFQPRHHPPRAPMTANSSSDLCPEALKLRISGPLAQRLALARVASLGATWEDTALTLLEAGFQAKSSEIRRFLESTMGGR
jgi:restriction endonuclease Mrr